MNLFYPFLSFTIQKCCPLFHEVRSKIFLHRISLLFSLLPLLYSLGVVQPTIIAAIDTTERSANDTSFQATDITSIGATEQTTDRATVCTAIDASFQTAYITSIVSTKHPT